MTTARRLKVVCFFLSLLAAFGGGNTLAQPNVLFIGNSYTQVNDLPQMTAEVSRSMGFDLTYSSNTPGGCTFSQHCTNTSMRLILQGDWDYVVLQEQSQYPSFPQEQVEAEVFPYATQLVNAVYAASPCAEPMFYMTWGRRDGDQYNATEFPILGTYEGMDSMLYERYLYMATANDASLCPVGRVWRTLRQNNPEIELYQSDGSHPSTAGTYAAACAFSVMFFHGDPLTITYIPTGLSTRDAQTIRQAVRNIVYAQLPTWSRPQPSVHMLPGEIDEGNATLCLHASHLDSLVLLFGDEHQLTLNAQPSVDSCLTHTYGESGRYNASALAMRHCMADTATISIAITLQPDSLGVGTAGIRRQDEIMVYPNPSTHLPTVVRCNGQPIQPDRITVITPDGRTIPYAVLNSHTLPAGLYLIEVKSEGNTYRHKFLLQ